MVHVIEEAFNICFYNITITSELQIKRQVAYGVLGTAFRAIPIAHRQEILFIDSCQYLGTAGLHEFVLDHRYPQGPEFVAVFGDVTS